MKDFLKSMKDLCLLRILGYQKKETHAVNLNELTKSGIKSFVLFEYASLESPLSLFVPLYQKLLSKKHSDLAHCVLYYYEERGDSKCWVRIDLTWDGLCESLFFINDDEDCIVDEENFALSVPVIMNFAAYKRLGFIKSLAYVGGSRIRFSPLACISMIVGSQPAFFNCSSFVSYVLFGTWNDTPSDLCENLLNRFKLGVRHE